MAYCTADDVKLLIRTNLSDANITSLIAQADADLDDMLGGASMSTTLKKSCSMRLTAIMIAQRQPTSSRILGASVTYGDRVKQWKQEVKNRVAKAVGRWHIKDPLEE